MSWIGLHRGVPTAFILALVGLTPLSPAGAAPFISEIVLPAAGTTAVEVAGLDAAGATLLVVDASRSNLSVRQLIALPAATPNDPATSLALVAGGDWPAGTPQTTATAIRFTAPLFLQDRPTALVLVQGQVSLGPSARLGTGSAVPGISSLNPIVDWVSFASGAFGSVQDPSAASVAALGISDLDRPTAVTTGFTALARALTADGPVMNHLLGGTTAGILGDAAKVQPFAFTPGRQNPLTTVIDDSDTPPVPEPGVGLLLALGGLWGARRPARRR
ncbi:MAG: hypothetical protein AAF086_06675 [Planctomycetota bacterium]